VPDVAEHDAAAPASIAQIEIRSASALVVTESGAAGGQTLFEAPAANESVPSSASETPVNSARVRSALVVDLTVTTPPAVTVVTASPEWEL
jgi:hypothetical protein